MQRTEQKGGSWSKVRIDDSLSKRDDFIVSSHFCEGAVLINIVCAQPANSEIRVLTFQFSNILDEKQCFRTETAFEELAKCSTEFVVRNYHFKRIHETELQVG